MQIDKSCLIVLTDLTLGGVTTSAVNFCNGLVERGARVDVLVMDVRSSTEGCGFSDEIRILRLKGMAKTWNLGMPHVRAERNPVKKVGLFSLGIIKKIVNRVGSWTDLIFKDTNMFSGYDVAVAFRQCCPCFHIVLHNVEAKKRVAFVHGDLAFMGDVSTWQPIMPEFDAVAYVSNAVKDGFCHRFPELSKNAVTVYNTFLVDKIRQKALLPCDVPFEKDRLNLVTVSRIENPVKGTGRIAVVCRMLKDRYPDRFHWYVVGDGPDMNLCLEKTKELDVGDHLTFLGADTNPFRYLSRADMCVFPTFTEAFPMVPGESLILGVPVVTTRYPAVAELLVDGQNGLIAEQSEESIFEKIAKLMDDPSLLEELKSNCAAFEYDNDRSFKQFADAIET